METYVGDGHASGGLPPGHSAQPRLVLDNAVGHTHLAAQGGQEQNQLRDNSINHQDAYERNYSVRPLSNILIRLS